MQAEPGPGLGWWEYELSVVYKLLLACVSAASSEKYFSSPRRRYSS